MAMDFSLYSSPLLYTLAMRFLYWPYFDDRYRVLAELIPEGASVVDACCGDSYLYSNFLAQKNVDYIGLDNSPAMVQAGTERGLDIRLWNALEDEVPEADVVVMQGALCHFMSAATRVISKLQAAAREIVLISEPIRDEQSSEIPLLNAVTKHCTRPVHDEGSYRGERFSESELRRLFKSQPGIIGMQLVPGGRELYCAIRGQTRV